MAKRRALWILALGLSACHGPTAPATVHQVSAAPDAIAPLRTDMVGVIERAAPAARNECGSASALLSAARAAPGDVAPRLRERLRAAVVPALATGRPACFATVAARLVPILPDADKRAVIGELARLFENGLDGWANYIGIMPAIAPHLTAEEARRFVAAVSTVKTPGCLRANVLAHLADAGRLPPADAFAAMTQSRDQHCLEFGELDVLRFADEATLRALYPSEMALLDEPASRFGLEHVRALSLLAPYLEPARRRPLLAAALRAMPAAFDPPDKTGNPWGDLSPEFHFYFAMLRLAPLIDAGLVDAALASIPPAWSAEARGYLAASIAAQLPAPLRRSRLQDFLAAIPGPRSSEGASAARLELADELPPEAVRDALEVVLENQTLPSTRAVTIAGALRALPPASRPAYAARIRADLDATAYADSRISAAALVIDRLDGIRR